MKDNKNTRIETLKLLISSQQLGSQREVLQALAKEGYIITQATLSRDLKQLKVAKAATLNGNYIYVLPNETMYKRVSTHKSASEMMLTSGFLSIRFSGNMAVMKTRPGYASSLAYNIDSSGVPGIVGTIAGNDTIFLVIELGRSAQEIVDALKRVIPGME